jgi:probable HAF family extracellular repeat protein
VLQVHNSHFAAWLTRGTLSRWRECGKSASTAGEVGCGLRVVSELLAVRRTLVGMFAHRSVLLLASVVAAGVAVPAHAAPVPVDLGTLPGGSASAAQTFGPGGEIIGWSTDANGAQRAVRWRDGRIADLGVPGEGPALALDVNAAGTIVGNTGNRAFAWCDGRVTLLSLPPGATASSARRINARGEIAGSVRYGVQMHAALWDRTGVHDLGAPDGYTESQVRALNDRGGAGGQVLDPLTDRYLPAVWSRGRWRVFETLGAIGDGNISVLDNRGVGAGLSTVSEVIYGEATVWAPDGSVHALGLLPGGDFSWILGTDGHGSYVGFANTEPGSDDGTAFISVRGGALQALPVPAGLNAVSTNAHGLDARGNVVGNATDADRNDHAILWRSAR